jgi:hypothetical protein
MKTFVSDGESIGVLETINRRGVLWIVSLWIEDQERNTRVVGRIIRLSGLSYRKLPPGAGADFVLDEPIPKGVLNGSIPPEKADGYIVEDHPSLKKPFGHAH